MKTMKALSTYAFALSLTAGLTGCGLGAGEENNDEHEEHDEDRQAPSNALDIPAPVRRNLGITFANVESRAVTQTMRIPGRFELLPTAQHDYVSPVNGRVVLHVQQYQRVEAGDVLATIDSPDWRALQAALVEAQEEVVLTAAQIRVSQASVEEQQQLIVLLEDRLDRLAQTGTRNAELDVQVAQSRLAMPGLEAELAAQEMALEAAHAKGESLMRTAATMTGLSTLELSETAADSSDAYWMTLDFIEIHATRDGVVDSLEITDGQWTEAGGHLVEVIAPNELRFMAESLQADLSKLRDGLPAQVVPPSGFGILFSELSRGELVIGPTAHAEDRSIRLFMTPELAIPWARAGMVGFLEITLTPDAETTLAIPRQAMVRDGLEFVFFRRDPDNKDQVFRVVADTGEHDGRWIQVKSGVLEGDEVVMDGVYQLLAASSSSAQTGGHFHADGTFHEEDH